MGHDETRVKRIFPIIWLASQVDAINLYIVVHQLNREALYLWLTHYGELIKPDPYLLGSSDPVADLHRYATNWGFHSDFGFLDNNRLKIYPRLAGFRKSYT